MKTFERKNPTTRRCDNLRHKGRYEPSQENYNSRQFRDACGHCACPHIAGVKDISSALALPISRTLAWIAGLEIHIVAKHRQAMGCPSWVNLGPTDYLP